VRTTATLHVLLDAISFYTSLGEGGCHWLAPGELIIVTGEVDRFGGVNDNGSTWTGQHAARALHPVWGCGWISQYVADPAHGWLR